MLSVYNCTLNVSLHANKCDCTAGRKRICFKQGFISLVFRAAVFSLSSSGSSRRGRESKQDKGDCWRDGGGGSRNWGRYGSCYSLPVILKWAHFQTLRHSLIGGFMSPTERQALPFPLIAQSANSRKLSNHIPVTSVLRRFLSDFSLPYIHSGHRGMVKAMSYSTCFISVKLYWSY